MDAWGIKISRANELIEDLNIEMKNYFLDSPPTTKTEITENLEVFSLVLAELHPIPDRWGAIVGDILHNLRSALDSLMFFIITSRAEQANLQVKEWQIHFPFVTNPSDLRSSSNGNTKWHQGLGTEELFTILDEFMPYYEELAPDLSQEEIRSATENSLLYILRNLSNDDKHRSTHLTICALDYIWNELPVGANQFAPVWQPRPWRQGEEIFKMRITGLPRDFSLQFKAQFAMALERDVGENYAHNLIDRMNGLSSMVAQSVFQLSSFATQSS